jgi:hypothetical protein
MIDFVWYSTAWFLIVSTRFSSLMTSISTNQRREYKSSSFPIKSDKLLIEKPDNLTNSKKKSVLQTSFTTEYALSQRKSPTNY